MQHFISVIEQHGLVVVFLNVLLARSGLPLHLEPAGQNHSETINPTCPFETCRAECYPGFTEAKRNTEEPKMKPSIRMIISVMLLSILFLPNSQAEELNHQEMVCALTGKCALPFVDRRVRGVTTPVAPRPALSFDSSINFNFNSAELTSDVKKELDKIIAVLKDPEVKDADVIVSGHTDAKGSDEYNQKLSERRALSVKQYLAQNGIDNKRLTASGYGKNKLLLPTQPLDALNRRVEFRNVKGVSPTETIKPATDEGL
jgi:outer membrane protein OmpA-like peptidoglycan-associated protein